MTVFWGLFFLLLSLGGLYLIIGTPISKKYGSSLYLDVAVGGAGVLVALIYLSIAHVMPLYDDEGSTQPCGAKSPQAICYGLDTETCSEAWKSFDAVCDEEVRPIREKRPAALLFNVIYKCHAQKFDKIVFYNRRRTENPFCREYFKKIE
jgi:hypothetical protein